MSLAAFSIDIHLHKKSHTNKLCSLENLFDHTKPSKVHSAFNMKKKPLNFLIIKWLIFLSMLVFAVIINYIIQTLYMNTFTP